MGEAHLTRSPRFPRRPPGWSAWNETARARPWTVGLEEVLLLLDPHGWSVANRAQDALEAAPRSLVSRAAAETHACVLELLTEPSRTVGDAVTELAGLRQELDRTLRERLGLRAAAAGTHPCADRSEVAGFASIRVPLCSMFPRSGIPRRFGTYEAYVHVIDRLLRSRAIPEPGFLWWDARLRPGFGTVEVRIMDARSRIADVAALAAVVQCLARRCAQEVAPARAAEPEVVSEELGCGAELASVAALAGDPGCERQRRLAARRGPEAILPRLGDELAVPGRFAATSSRR